MQRGQIGIVRFFLGLIMGVPLVYIATQVTEPILDRAGESSADTAAAPATEWLATGGEYLLVIFLLVSFFGLIALAIYQRGVGQ